MPIVHQSADEEAAETVLATDVDVADSALQLARGLRFRESLPEGYGFVMHVGGGGLLPFGDDTARNVVDMLFMRVSLDVLWVIDEEVVATKTMHPWRSFGFGKADTVIELPAGTASDVREGDVVRVVPPEADE